MASTGLLSCSLLGGLPGRGAALACSHLGRQTGPPAARHRAAQVTSRRLAHRGWGNLERAARFFLQAERLQVGIRRGGSGSGHLVLLEPGVKSEDAPGPETPPAGLSICPYASTPAHQSRPLSQVWCGPLSRPCYFPFLPI